MVKAAVKCDGYFITAVPKETEGGEYEKNEKTKKNRNIVYVETSSRNCRGRLRAFLPL